MSKQSFCPTPVSFFRFFLSFFLFFFFFFFLFFFSFFFLFFNFHSVLPLQVVVARGTFAQLGVPTTPLTKVHVHGSKRANPSPSPESCVKGRELVKWIRLFKAKRLVLSKLSALQPVRRRVCVCLLSCLFSSLPQLNSQLRYFFPTPPSPPPHPPSSSSPRPQPLPPFLPPKTTFLGL